MSDEPKSKYPPSICIGGVYSKEGKNGTYLTGKLNHNRIMIFPNKDKKEDKDPDYLIYLTPNRTRSSTG